ncbi:MAG TPA: DUF3592 domain-containing protein [Niastella sp.]
MEYVFIIGLVLLIVGLLFLKDRISYIKKGNKAIASVIETKEYLDSDNDKMYKPVFKFITHNNEEIIFECSGSSSRSMWPIGEEVKIVYNGENPNKMLLLTLFNAFGIPLILLTLALILLFIAGGYWWSQHFFNSLY